MRRIYNYMSLDEKAEALRLLRDDLAELHQELNNEYPRVVRDAIEETIRRYTYDVECLENELKQAQNKDA